LGARSGARLLATLVALTERDLPEPDLPRRDVDVAGQPAKGVERRKLLLRGHAQLVHVAPVQDADTRPDVAQRDADVDIPADDLDRGAASGNDQVDAVHE